MLKKLADPSADAFESVHLRDSSPDSSADPPDPVIGRTTQLTTTHTVELRCGASVSADRCNPG